MPAGAKLLNKFNAHGCVHHAGSFKTGARSTISSADVAAALAFGGLTIPAWHYAQARYCGDAASAAALQEHLCEKIQRQITLHGWRDATGRADRIAALLMFENVYAHACQACRGSGRQHVGAGAGAAQACSACGGLGVAKLSNAKKAAIAGISPAAWSRNWSARLLPFTRYLQQLDAQVLNCIATQFS